MGQPKTDSPTLSTEPQPGDRLDSWKDLANHLNRGVRTVQRWERQEGLPVHRHQHEKLGTVYAFKSEIDAWWASRRAQLKQQGNNLDRATRRVWVWAAALAVAVSLAGAGAAVWWTRGPALPFEERDWVLIATFENRTGDPVFDGTLEYALERELSNSRFVNVVPRERINDTLELMRKPLDTRVDAAVGREVALRDGGIRGLLTGRVEKLGTTYMLSAAVVNPANGVTVTSFSEEALGQGEVVGAVRRLSSHVRAALGEELSQVHVSDQELEKVTTPSLRALQLYSQGMALVNRGEFKPAAELLKGAVAEDPDFASAHILLAHCYSNMQKEGLAARHYRRAFELAPTTPDRERFFILGSYYQRFLRDEEEAIQAYERLVRHYPDHYWGTRNLALAYSELGRLEEATSLILRQADLRPNDFPANFRAAFHLLRMKGSLDQSEPYLGRARALAQTKAAKNFPTQTSLIAVLRAYEDWLRGDVRHALAEADRLAGTLDSRSAEERPWFATNLGGLYHDLGKLKRAEELYEVNSNKAVANWNLARVAWDRADDHAFTNRIKRMNEYREQVWWLPVSEYARAGLLREAEKAVRRIEQQKSPREKLVRGELAFYRGQIAEAIPLLEAGVKHMRELHWPEASEGSQFLAHALEQRGNLVGAAEVLEAASGEKTQIVIMGGAPEWMRTQHQLAQVYRKLGRDPEAQRIEEELLKLLAYADPDHAIARELRAASKLRAAAVPR